MHSAMPIHPLMALYTSPMHALLMRTSADFKTHFIFTCTPDEDVGMLTQMHSDLHDRRSEAVDAAPVIIPPHSIPPQQCDFL